MNDLEVFSYTGQQVRTVLIDGAPWFVVADVCSILGLTNPSVAASSLDVDDLSTTEVIDSMGRRQIARVASESGLYRLIFQSRKPAARDFQSWVTKVVLPQIRKTGSFSTAVPMSYPEALRAAADAAEEAERLKALREIEAPKVEAFDTFMDADGSYSMESAAKSLADVTGGMGRTKLFAWLRAERVLMSNNSPYQQYAHWFKVVVGSYDDTKGVAHPTKTTYVKPAGLEGIRRRFTRKDS